MNKRCISTMRRNVRAARQCVASAKKQSGSTLILAIFIIIVISLLGASLMSLQRDSAEGTSYEVFAARTYLAAYSGSEIALAELFPPASTASCVDVNATPTLPNNTGFTGCKVDSVTCNLIPASGDVSPFYRIVSTATCENSQINTRRQITVDATIL